MTRKYYHFRVLCLGTFPTEMLMKERCWPRNETSASLITESIKHPQKFSRYFMHLASDKRPRSKKWPDNTILLEVIEKTSKNGRKSKKKVAKKVAKKRGKAAG